MKKKTGLRMRAGASVVAAGVLAAIAPFENATAQPTQTTTVLKAARLFDATSGTLRSNGVIVVQGEKIVSVTSGNDARVPADASIIDLGDATLLPGFIDAHTHLTYEFQENWHKGVYEELMRFPAEQAHYAALRARRTLEAGFTTVRNVGAVGYVDVGLRNAVDAGVAEGPRVLTAVYSLGSTGGHCDQSPFPPDNVPQVGPVQGVCNGAEECREAVRTQMKFGADVIKICASGGVLSEADPVDVPQLTPAELSAIVGEAHTWKRKTAAHSHGDVAARLAIEAGVDSIEHGSFLTESTLKLMKQKGVYLVPTRMAVFWVNKSANSYPPKIADKARAAYAAHADMFKTALRVGVPIALGTDAGVFPHGMNGMEFGLMTDLGMKFADIVAVPGDVIANIRATEKPVFVMKHGRVVVRKAAAP
jgi:imidazolonepropionase-like amidohydrolase